MNTPLIDACGPPRYWPWTPRRVGPAYVRGIPSWVWESALNTRRVISRVTPT